ncbi:MAG: hypothetical protein AAF668_08915 [Pseudomonadota bacterium]
MGKVAFQLMVVAVSTLTLGATNGSAIAGDYTSPSADGAGTYAFSSCERPEIPVLTEKDRAKLQRSVRFHNKKTREYNVLVAAMNAYFECLQAEADGDINAFYAAVSKAFEREQATTMKDADLFRSALDRPARSNGKDPVVAPTFATDEELEKSLLGRN